MHVDPVVVTIGPPHAYTRHTPPATVSRRSGQPPYLQNLKPVAAFSPTLYNLPGLKSEVLSDSGKTFGVELGRTSDGSTRRRQIRNLELSIRHGG